MKRRIFYLITTFVAFLVVIMFSITFLIERSTINDLSLEQLDEKITERIDFFNDFVEHRKKLLNSLSSNLIFEDFVKSGKNKHFVENLYLSHALSHNEVFQFRYLDNNGNEVVRVDNYNKPKLISEDKLQNKSNRYYFKDTMSLQKGEYFFSNIDLNRERGKIEKPIMPTLRIATPIIINNIKYGIVIININLNDFLKKLQDTSLHYVNLVYDDGQIIINKNNKFNWTRDFKNQFDVNKIFVNIPHDYNKYDSLKTDNFFITKLPINTKNKIFMILLPKELKTYIFLYEDLKENLVYLFIIIILSMPLAYLIASYIEKSYQKKIELKEELSKLKKVMDYSPISIMITDANANIEYINSSFTLISGIDSHDIIGNNLESIKSELTTSIEYKEIWNILKSKNTWRSKLKSINNNGDVLWESITISPSLNDKNEIINFLLVKQEITKEVYLEKVIKDKEEIMIAQSRHAAMGEMISMIAHQWRQPISVISMIGNNILLDLELGMIDNDEIKEQSESILEQTTYLSTTIDDFRNYFKPNKNMEIVNPKDIVAETLKIVSKSLENNNINIKYTVEADYKIKVFSRELLQVLINLLKNAKEAFDNININNKLINISIKKVNNNVRIEVYDNASMINEEIGNKIFEPYFSTKDEKTGTGLGLYMSKTIVEKHLNGKLCFENYNDGVNFYIDLPLYLNGRN